MWLWTTELSLWITPLTVAGVAGVPAVAGVATRRGVRTAASWCSCSPASASRVRPGGRPRGLWPAPGPVARHRASRPMPATWPRPVKARLLELIDAAEARRQEIESEAAGVNEEVRGPPERAQRGREPPGRPPGPAVDARAQAGGGRPPAGRGPGPPPAAGPRRLHRPVERPRLRLVDPLRRRPRRAGRPPVLRPLPRQQPVRDHRRGGAAAGRAGRPAGGARRRAPGDEQEAGGGGGRRGRGGGRPAGERGPAGGGRGRSWPSGTGCTGRPRPRRPSSTASWPPWRPSRRR